MADPQAEALDPATGEVVDTYTIFITDANAAMRVHDRMPVILVADAARRQIEPGPLPAGLLVPYLAEEMQAWGVGGAAKNSRIELRWRAQGWPSPRLWPVRDLSEICINTTPTVADTAQEEEIDHARLPAQERAEPTMQTGGWSCRLDGNEGGHASQGRTPPNG